MKGKLLFVAGAAIGYVLGARAGRARYEQIRGAAQRVWETPGIQAQVENAKDFAAQRVGDIPGALTEGAKKLMHAATAPRTDARSDRRAAKNTDSGSSARAGSAGDDTAKEPAAKPAATKPAATTSAAKRPGAKKPAAKKPAAKKPAAKKPAAKKPATDA